VGDRPGRLPHHLPGDLRAVSPAPARHRERPRRVRRGGTGRGIHDNYRIDYLRAHIEQIQWAISDGVEVIGYCPWSAIDLVSTHQGISKGYGFIYVDRGEDDLRTLGRLKKDSFFWYHKLIDANALQA
jgi:beta-glucosidase/6-phospho-beta-glucosidase/beta-galactosidase